MSADHCGDRCCEHVAAAVGDSGRPERIEARRPTPLQIDQLPDHVLHLRPVCAIGVFPRNVFEQHVTAAAGHQPGHARLAVIGEERQYT